MLRPGHTAPATQTNSRSSTFAHICTCQPRHPSALVHPSTHLHGGWGGPVGAVGASPPAVAAAAAAGGVGWRETAELQGAAGGPQHPRTCVRFCVFAFVYMCACVCVNVPMCPMCAHESEGVGASVCPEPRPRAQEVQASTYAQA